MIEEWGGTLTLTEASSRELMRVLKEQDAEFMDALFNGKCGFTLKCTDGRSVELIPKADRKTENSSEKPNNSTISKMEQVDEPQKEIKGSKRLLKGSDEPQKKSCATCKHALGNWDGESNNCGRCCGADRRFYEPKDEPQTERSE